MGYGNITDKQREILKYLESQILLKGYPPSVREICQAVRLSSTSSVHAHLNALEKNGYIRRDSSKTRAIEILDDSFQMARTENVSIPIVGRIAAINQNQPLPKKRIRSESRGTEHRKLLLCPFRLYAAYDE